MIRGVRKVFELKNIFDKICIRSLSESAKTKDANNGPLSSVRILDLSRIIAGPLCTMILSDLGAEVIKVENPEGGDLSRSFGPPFIKSESVYFLALNRNKKSIAIDLKFPEGRNLIKELAKESDVLVENFIPKKMSEFGLDYENLKLINPKLIYASISGFGSSGPYSKRPCLDIIASSIGGLLNITGPQEGDPCIPGIPATDITTSLFAHGAIMAALLQRMQTGRGQKIECDLLASQMATLVHIAQNYLSTGEIPRRMGSCDVNVCPYQAFKTKDGYISVTCPNNKAFESLCKVLNISNLSQEPAFTSNIQRVRNRAQLSKILQDVFVTNTTKYWTKAFEGSQLPYGAVNNMEEAFKDPQVIHKQMVQEVEHSAIGKMKVLGPAVTYSYSCNKVRSSAPCLGEHTEMVLSDVLSYSEEKIRKLREAKIIN